MSTISPRPAQHNLDPHLISEARSNQQPQHHHPNRANPSTTTIPKHQESLKTHTSPLPKAPPTYPPPPHQKHSGTMSTATPYTSPPPFLQNPENKPIRPRLIPVNPHPLYTNTPHRHSQYSPASQAVSRRKIRKCNQEFQLPYSRNSSRSSGFERQEYNAAEVGKTEA